MNKKTIKIAGWALGLSMSVAGIGAAVGGATHSIETGAAAPVEVLSFSRSGTNNSFTTGYTFSSAAEGKTGYYQDGSGTERSLSLYHKTEPLWDGAPTSVSFTATLGGGSVKDDLANSVYVCYLNKSGAVIDGTSTLVTDAITSTTGSAFNVSMATNPSSTPYGVKLYHQKETGYNVRYYSFSLSITTSATVSYNANGGSGSAMDVTKANADDKAVPSACTYTFPGKYFTGWKDGSGNDYAPGTEYTFESNTVLYAQWADATLESITVNTAPSKVLYAVGETFDPTGLKLNLNYEEGNATSKVVSYGVDDGFTFTPNTSTVLSKLDSSVTIGFGGKTTSQAITVTEPFTYSSLEASSSKKYHLGDAFDKSSVSIKAVYTNSVEEINRIDLDSEEVEWDIPATFAEATGVPYTITVSYTVDDVEKSAEIVVTLDTITNIEVTETTLPDYIVFGEEVSRPTVTVTAYTASEPSGFVANDGYVTVADTLTSLVLGPQTVSVSYGGKTTTISTTVTNAGSSFDYPEKALTTASGFTNSSMTHVTDPDDGKKWWADGQGSDYADTHDPYLLKLDSTNDCIVYFDESNVLTNDKNLVIKINVKMIGGANTSYFDITALDSDGDNLSNISISGSGVVSSGTNAGKLAISGSQNSVINASVSLSNPNAQNIYGIKFLFTKGSNIGVSSAGIYLSARTDSAGALAQANAFADYLSTFKTCQSGWINRSDIATLADEYNNMVSAAKTSFESLTIADYDWTKKGEYDIETHSYGEDAPSLAEVSAIAKLKDMVASYNSSLQPSEALLVLETPTGDFSSYQAAAYRGFDVANDHSLIVTLAVSAGAVLATAGIFLAQRKRKED